MGIGILIVFNEITGDYGMSCEDGNQKKSNWIIALLILLVCLLVSFHDEVCAMSSNRVPTVTVVDEETGEPVEGVVAIAIWRKHSIKERAWWEGGTMVVVKIKEAVSDKDGNIYIDGFWGWYIAKNRYPRLTIYKPGYVCWDQINLYEGGLRKDFDKDHRIARIEKWSEGFSFNAHSSFVNGVTFGDIYDAPRKLFNKAFDYERPFRIKESNEISRKRKEAGEKKERGREK